MVLDLDLETFFVLAALAGGLGSFTPSIAADKGKTFKFEGMKRGIPELPVASSSLCLHTS